MLDRRHLLKYAAALPLTQLVGVSTLSAANGTAPMRFIVDTRLPDAGHLIEQARRGDHAVVDPEGEIIRLMLRPSDPLPAHAGSLLGLTGYSDFILAQDALRAMGRPMRYAARIDGAGRHMLFDREARNGESSTDAAIATLFDPAALIRSSPATSFVWLA
ncbi:MAG: hypothetical protein AB7D33_02565 [Sphingobium sp.]